LEYGLCANWRIVFRMEGGHAIEVDLIDYHQEKLHFD